MRTAKQIEEDYAKVKKAAETATTIKEVEDITGLSKSQISTTLSKHPIAAKRLREQIKSNRQAKIEKLKEESKLDSDVKQKEEGQQVEDSIETISGFVIDASFTGTVNFKETLEEMYSSSKKIILTDTTIDELSKLQKFKDVSGKNACHILNEAIEKPEKFELISIDKTFDKPDDNIIEFCKNKDVILLTSDKEMTLKARMNNIKVKYYKKSRIDTLRIAKKIGSNLTISELQKENVVVCVYSNGIKYSKGLYNLKIGDDVFISAKRDGYVTFSHFRMVSLEQENNCQVMYSNRIYDYKNVNLEKKTYTAFVKDFISRF